MRNRCDNAGGRAPTEGGSRRRVFAEANRLGVPILSLDAFMAFWEARAAPSCFAALLSAAERCPGRWRWALRTPVAVRGLALLVPATALLETGAGTRVALDGQPCPARSFAAFGREYLAVPLDVRAGEHTVEVRDSSSRRRKGEQKECRA